MFKALFSARGRMRRRDWWLWSIAVSVVLVIGNLVMDQIFASGQLTADMAAFKGWPTNAFEYWLMVSALIGVVAKYCLTAKRWQDRNRPGWLAGIGAGLSLIYFALTHFGAGLDVGFTAKFGLGMVSGGIVVASLIYSVWMLIDCGILDGTPGPNRYGPSPKGLGVTPADVF